MKPAKDVNHRTVVIRNRFEPRLRIRSFRFPDAEKTMQLVTHHLRGFLFGLNGIAGDVGCGKKCLLCGSIVKNRLALPDITDKKADMFVMQGRTNGLFINHASTGCIYHNPLWRSSDFAFIQPVPGGVRTG